MTVAAGHRASSKDEQRANKEKSHEKRRKKRRLPVEDFAEHIKGGRGGKLPQKCVRERDDNTGGYNSGGRNKTHKTVENYRKIDSFAFYRFLMFDKYLHCKDVARYKGTSGDIIYHVQDKTAEIETGGLRVPLKLSKVPGIDGRSIRLYFYCPYCGRRVRYLYDFRSHYVCRHCLRANYRIQQESGMSKLRRQMENIVVKKLQYYWWREEPGVQIFELYMIPKPPYMRWEKYARMFRCGIIPDRIKGAVVRRIGKV